MKLYRTIRIVFISLFSLLIVGTIILIRYTNDIGEEYRKSIIERECVGIIDSIDMFQASKYFYVQGDKYAFGRIGRKMVQYTNVGDSIIKEANSSDILIVKSTGEKRKFMIY